MISISRVTEEIEYWNVHFTIDNRIIYGIGNKKTIAFNFSDISKMKP